jgi:hypothetical protein
VNCLEVEVCRSFGTAQIFRQELLRRCRHLPKKTFSSLGKRIFKVLDSSI